ncbi:MAG: divergent polysaccharide deacetylase family protein [Desulfuromonadaceae bacterium]|nr:divergent polysaccharide deacetylase family protein [Desulfuromonadaceae bacterium]
MRKRGQKRIKEPRRGALAITLLLAFVAIALVTAYFLLAPYRKKFLPEVKKPEILLNTTTARPYPHAPPAAIPPAAEQKPASDKETYPKADIILPEKIPLSKITPGKGYLAIIIDDMGSSMTEALSLAKIAVPLTFSIIPGLRHDRDVALFAKTNGIETMVHIPMQSKGWPEQRLEANGLLLSMNDAELRDRVAGFLRDIPGAVGANNHMGSEFTEHDDKMRSVLETLKSKNLFFVDSFTSIQTTGLRVARELGIRSDRRHVFLDNEQKRGYILGQLGQAAKLAKKSGYAIAICHPHPETIATLASALPGLAAQGITLVPASQLVR